MNQRSNKIQKLHTRARSTTMSFFGQTFLRYSKADGVHSYFSFGCYVARTKPTFPQHALEKSSPGGSSAHAEGRRQRANLPPYKMQFDAQRKLLEIQVVNDRLDVNAASYSTYLRSRHALLVFANHPPTYEMVFESSSWPTSICGIPFKVSLPSRIPMSYSILINRVPRDWYADSIRPLIAQRYPSTVQVARIFPDGQPINQSRVDFPSNDDIQKIPQRSHISIDSI